MRVPDEVGDGKAKITLSFPDWKDAKVTPVTLEARIAEAEKESQDEKGKAPSKPGSKE